MINKVIHNYKMNTVSFQYNKYFINIHACTYMLLSNNISILEYNYAVFLNCLGIFIIDFNYHTNINISF